MRRGNCLWVWAMAAGILILAAGKGGAVTAQTETYTLDNGLKVVQKTVASAPVVSVFIWYRVGARNEPAGQSGLAHFLEHMLFKGTQHYAKGEIARLIGRTGGHQNAFTSYDYTAYFETVPVEHLELALSIEADRMRRALLDPREAESERTVILSELDGNRNYPQVRLRDLVNAQARLHHPYRRPVIGWRDEVERLTAAHLKAFYDTYYLPNNATLVVVGDVDGTALRKQIRRLFGGIPPGPEIPAEHVSDEIQQGLRRVELRDHGPTGLLQVNLPIPPATHEDHFALTVLNDALTRGKTSRLYRALVDTGLAASVDGNPQEMIDSGTWVLSAVCQDGVDPARVEEVIRREFRRVQQEPLSPEEFVRSVNQTRAQLIFSKDSLTDQAMLMGFYQTVAGDWSLPDRYPERVAAVTPEQVRQAARTYLDESRWTVGHFLPLGPDGGGPVGPPPTDTLSARPQPQPAPGDPVGPEVPGATRSAGGPERGGSQRVVRHVLGNGLVLVLQVNPSNPTLALSGSVRAGTVSEPDNRPGLAVVHARMLERGTATYTAAQLAEALESKGAQLNYAAGYEELAWSGEALSEDVELILDALAQTLTAPTFPAKEVEKVRKETLVSARQARDSAQVQAWQGFQELAYPKGHPMRRSLLYAEEGLRRITRDDLVAYHRIWIRPETTILSLAGDFDPATVIALVEATLGGWAAPGAVPSLDIPEMAPVAASRESAVALPGKSESIVVLGHEGIHRLDPDYYPAYVANQVLGGAGLSSLLMRTVRDQEGLTYSIYSQFRPYRGQRPWVVMFQADPRNVEQAVRMTKEQVRRLQAGDVPAQDLDDSREQLVGGLSLSLETNSGIAYLNREIEVHHLGLDYLETFPRAVRGVSFADMQAAARTWFHPDRVLESSAGPAPAGPVERKPANP